MRSAFRWFAAVVRKRRWRNSAELSPGNPRYSYVLGIALNSMGQQAEAVTVLRAAHARFDGDIEIAMGLASVLRDTGDQGGALDIAYALARRHPEDQNVVALLRSLQAIPQSADNGSWREGTAATSGNILGLIAKGNWCNLTIGINRNKCARPAGSPRRFPTVPMRSLELR